MLYKYLSNNNYNLEALSRQTIFFSRPSCLNDPFDCCDIIQNSYKNSQLCCGTFTDFGVFSVAEGNSPNNLRLWAHYAENFKGYVIEYKEEIGDILSKEYICPLSVVPIIYKERPLDLDAPEIKFEDVDGDFKTIVPTLDGKKDPKIYEALYLHLLRRKNKAVWKEEYEKRIILGTIARKQLINKKDAFEICTNGYLLKLPAGVITHVYIGLYNERKTELVTLCNKNQIPVSLVTPVIKNNQWTVDIHQLYPQTQ